MPAMPEPPAIEGPNVFPLDWTLETPKIWDLYERAKRETWNPADLDWGLLKDAFTPEQPKHYLIKEVDVAKQTLSVTRAGKEFVTSWSVGDAEILLEGNESELTDLKPGMQVSLSFVATGGQLSLRRIQARK